MDIVVGDSSSSRAKVFLLGSPCVEHNCEAVKPDTRKAIALLAYLAVTKRRHGRDTLAALLWPDYGRERAHGALRRTLSALKSVREEGWLEVDRTSARFVGEEVWVDVDRFREVLAECGAHGHGEDEVCPDCLPLLEEGAALYRDDFLAGFGLRDSFAFDEWQYFEAENLRRELAGALERLARGYGANSEWELAIARARRWLALDPLHEPAHRSLMHLYALSGRRADALRQYRECIRILGAELSVHPLEETARLYRAIKENTPPPPLPLHRPRNAVRPREEKAGSPHEASAASLVSGDPLVGRENEWEALSRAYDAARARVQTVIVEGEAGIGKTRLVEEFLLDVSTKGAKALVARCYAGETNLAYGLFTEGLSEAIGRPDSAARLEGVPGHFLSEATRLLPQLAGLFPDLPSLPPLEGPGARTHFFEGVGRVLSAVCAGEYPWVLFLDDLHWADEASLDLLSYLVRRLGRFGSTLLVVLAWRSEQLPAAHRMRALVTEVRREHAVTVLTLPRLNRGHIEELLLPVPIGSEHLAQRLYDETEGLPLLVAEYLKALAEGVPHDAEDEWSLPDNVRDVLLARLATVSETGWQLLAAAATIGRSFDFDTVREASGRGEEEAVAALEELVSRGVITESERVEQDPSYDFVHEKLRALVYDETSLARRRLLHRRVAETLAGRVHRGNRAAAAQIARHYQLAGQEAKAAEHFGLAGEHARGLYANADALVHFRTALALGHPEAAALHEAAGDLHTLLGDYGAALTSYERAAALTGGWMLAVVERKLGLLHQRRGDWELAESHHGAALELLGDSGPAGERARLRADLALVARRRDRLEEAAELGRQALRLAETAEDPRAVAHACNVLGIVAGAEGDQVAACEHLEHSLRLAESLEDPYARIAALNNLARAHGAGGDTERAIEQTGAALDLCVRLGDRHREAALHNNLADLLHSAGRPEDSMEHLKQAVVIFAEIGKDAEIQPGIWKLTEW